jgi:hypothetical protein
MYSAERTGIAGMMPNWRRKKMVEALKSCPICHGNVKWCGDHDPEDIHECHFIKCVGKCGTQFDTVANDSAADTFEELKIIAAARFNDRHTPDDMVMVPRKPTSAMMNMFWIACQDIDFDTDGGFEFAYKAMIEATK